MDELRGKENYILPNNYIPVMGKNVLQTILSRLPRKSLLELIQTWPKIKSTQAQASEGDSEHERRILNTRILKEAKLWADGSKKFSKRKIIDKIVFEYWKNGLSLLQLSQIDCQLIVDRPNAFQWVHSTARDSHGKELAILLDPKKFLHMLAADLSHLYLTYIYVCRHSKLPMVIVRIQLFDLQAFSKSEVMGRPHISSHRPYFLAIPANSPHVIHTLTSDLASNIILQSVEKNLSLDRRNVLHLVTNPEERLVRSLEAMHIFYGNSRFSNSLGMWTPYAQGSVDILPLGRTKDHSCLSNVKQTLENTNTDKKEEMREIARRRFKGVFEIDRKTTKLFDVPEKIKNKHSRKEVNNRTCTLNLPSHEEEEEEEEANKDIADAYNSNSIQPNEFSSIAPVQFIEFTLNEKLPIIDKQAANEELHSGEKRSSLRLRFTGSDIFAGLHELATKVTDDSRIILDPTKIPSWLTGEEGANSGMVKDGKLYRQ